MAKKKGNEPKPEKRSKVSGPGELNPSGASEQDRSQTHGALDQDPKRRIGHFGGTGEPPYKEPGRRQ
jgi:hypothetical protein